MFKRIVLVLLLALATPLFFGCGEEVVEEESVSYQKREGTIRPLGVSIYQQGTHRLERDGALIALLEAAGPNINLDLFAGKEVEVEGIVSPTVEGNLEIVKVVALTPKEGAGSTESASYERYTDDQFGFSAKYPSTIAARESRLGSAFFDSQRNEKIIEVVVLENSLKQELSDWLIDNYGYTADSLTRVAVSGLSGYQFQNTTGSVIYLGHENEVFTLAWYDNDEVNRARNRRYYLEFVQSFVVAGVSTTSSGELESESGALAQAGEFCGGIAAVACVEGLECRLSGSYPDAGGTCVATDAPAAPGAVTSDQIEANPDLSALSAAELQRGWYYGDTDQKKPGTPETWILVNAGTRSAMWRRVEDAPIETPVELPDATTTANALPSEQQSVLTYLGRNIEILAPEAPDAGEWELAQLAFADPNFVYAIYTADSQTRRLLFVYTVADDTVEVEMQAYFLPGEERDWIVSEGADTAFGKALTIVDASGVVAAEILEGYRLFRNIHQAYSLQYPKNWYWRNATKSRTEFSDQPFPAGLVLVTAAVVEGVDYPLGELISEAGESVVYAQLSDTRSIRISAATDYAGIVQVMATTFEAE